MRTELVEEAVSAAGAGIRKKCRPFYNKKKKNPENKYYRPE